MDDLIYLIVFDCIVLGMWYWMCFMGGDEKLCVATHTFWKGAAYKNLKPVHCRIFVWIFVVAVAIGNIGVLIKKLQ